MNEMFHGLNATGQNANDYGLIENDDALHKICETELNSYLMYVCTGACHLYNNEHVFNDPLK